jgi:anti-sigma factor RsiW
METHDCRHLLGDLSDYVDGQASAALCAEIERHLADCTNCRVVIDTLRQTVKLYRGLPGPALPPGARERLYHSLDLGQFLRGSP